MSEATIVNYDYNPSEGEKFIEEFFKSQKIKYKSQYAIANLRNDTKRHRVADFYLPQYGLYVEFNGLWNNTKLDRERYQEKAKVFFGNDIPCIYLYPENLGTISYTFTIRAIKELKKRSMKKELFLFRYKRLINDRGNLFIYLIFALLLLYRKRPATPVYE